MHTRSTLRTCLAVAAFAVAAFSFLSSAAWADAAAATDSRWSFRTRAFVSGESFDSEPANFKAYSGIALEAALRRALGPRWAAEFSLHTESRELDHLNGAAPADRLGSLEMLPATIAVLYRTAGNGKVHPYGGVGVNFTVAWEKSGVVDSLDVSPSLGPAVQLGVDTDLAPNVLLNFDLRWNRLRTELKNHGVRYTKLDIDPVTLGGGIGFRF